MAGCHAGVYRGAQPPASTARQGPLVRSQCRPPEIKILEDAARKSTAKFRRGWPRLQRSDSNGPSSRQRLARPAALRLWLSASVRQGSAQRRKRPSEAPPLGHRAQDSWRNHRNANLHTIPVHRSAPSLFHFARGPAFTFRLQRHAHNPERECGSRFASCFSTRARKISRANS